MASKEIKAKLYKDFYKRLMRDTDFSSLQYPQVKDDYDFSCEIEGIHIEYSLKEQSDLFTVKATVRVSNEKNTQAYADRIVRGTNLICNVIDAETILIQYSLPCSGYSDKKTYSMIDDAQKRFFTDIKKVANNIAKAQKYSETLPVMEDEVVQLTDKEKKELEKKQTKEEKAKKKGRGWLFGRKKKAVDEADAVKEATPAEEYEPENISAGTSDLMADEFFESKGENEEIPYPMSGNEGDTPMVMEKEIATKAEKEEPSEPDHKLTGFDNASDIYEDDDLFADDDLFENDEDTEDIFADGEDARSDEYEVDHVQGDSIAEEKDAVIEDPDTDQEDFKRSEKAAPENISEDGVNKATPLPETSAEPPKTSQADNVDPCKKIDEESFEKFCQMVVDHINRKNEESSAVREQEEALQDKESEIERRESELERQQKELEVDRLFVQSEKETIAAIRKQLAEKENSLKEKETEILRRQKEAEDLMELVEAERKKTQAIALQASEVIKVAEQLKEGLGLTSAGEDEVKDE